ncbi:rab11 family-interacting protein 4A-like [Varroa jacobsoni]|uniref:Rab11 family-interacting protein 4A n=2 Tax=Varroa destructor TaxID=109461 RepID=A0A7M7JQV9_VARDE|nr:rab11 family-interacting protein 3-like isoform X1 [Varroa destructor]XP_022698708.1 rab11 family-interacting protein 4A-like [Varroa jacobsoni]
MNTCSWTEKVKLLMTALFGAWQIRLFCTTMMCTVENPVDMGAAVEENSDFQDELRRIFNLCDHQGQGYIDKDAFYEIEKNMFEGSEEQMASIMEYFDPSNRGVITFEDFCRGVAAITSNHLQQQQQQQGLSSPRDSSPDSLRQEVQSPTSSTASAVGVLPSSEGASLSSLMRAQSPADSGLGERAEERFEYEEEEDTQPPLTSNLRNSDSFRETSPGSPNSRRLANRNAWSRTSIRRSSCSSKRFAGSSLGRELSAAAVANASFNSAQSRRSSFSYEQNNELDSLADQQVLDDLTDKVQEMEIQITALTEDLATSKDLYQRAKQENSLLTQRIHALEENIRELECKTEERVREERKQFTTMMERKDRERALESEQHVNKILELQNEHMATKEETVKLRTLYDQLKQEKKIDSEQLSEATHELQTTKQDLRAFQEVSRREREDFQKEKQVLQEVIQDLTHRLEELQHLRQRNVTPQEGDKLRERSASFIQNLPLHCETMEKELERLQHDNRRLKERNEELDEELIGLKVGQGQRLLNSSDSATHDNNWAAETDDLNMLSKEELVGQLRRLQDTNVDLREYIGTVLSNIIMTYPQMLEKKI